MNRVRVDLQNCYGIRKLRYDFNFSKRTAAYAIYAPNGSMKSSLAQTFKDVAEGNPSTDRIFPSRKSIRKITDQNGADLPGASVLVLPPYDEVFGPNEQTATILVNQELSKEWVQLNINLEQAKAAFLKAMNSRSGSSRDLEKEISSAFLKTDADFYGAIERVKGEVKSQKDAPFADVPYESIFDDRVISALETKDVRGAIEEYINRYNKLLAASIYFKKGVFEYYNANQIARQLDDNGFFAAKHAVIFHGGKKLEITTRAQLEELTTDELNNITNDPQLKKTFDGLRKALDKNATVRDFRQYLSEHELLLPHLANIDLFKEQIWKSYFKAETALYENLLSELARVKTRQDEIAKAAEQQRSHWHAAIDLFNARFVVPFKLEVKNHVAVALSTDKILNLGYTFSDGDGSAPVEHDKLVETLSQGEKKALYILNIIFEVEVRRQQRRETLFVIDDIADSFDYKNKYAIIQYLQDISEDALFKQIILTHNFDFFRTIHNRFIVDYDNCLMAAKGDKEVTLSKAVGIKNIFVNSWKADFFSDAKKRVASILFMRNLIEYTKGESDPEYLKLTSLLHWKEDSNAITQRELDDVYNKLFGSSKTYADASASVVEMIQKEAESCLGASEGANFEHKIVLSIGIRLAAERFMARKIADPAFLASIQDSQTAKLLTQFEKVCNDESDAISILRNVVLMTPENIHLNSFMYEPILDMSDNHLKKLFREVCALPA
jgi:hypothetical protein